MNKDIELQIKVYEEKLLSNSVKETWVINNLPLLYNYIKDGSGDSISEKIYLISNNIGLCKNCFVKTKFLSYKRGYREFCSKKCSNNNLDLIEQKKSSYIDTCLDKYGFENASKSDIVKDKIKLSKLDIDWDDVSRKIKATCLSNWGVDNPSKLDVVKDKKKKTSLSNFGVDNPFKSIEIKDKIKNTNIQKYGFHHPMQSPDVRNKVMKTNLENCGSENFKSSEYSKINTLIYDDVGYIKYLGESNYQLKCELKGHLYEIKYDNYYHRKVNGHKTCTTCNPIMNLVSSIELSVLEFIKHIYSGSIINSYRDGLEIDIYLPELKIGFEVNGIFWHTDSKKYKNYHIDKTMYFQKRGIRIIHIWEDDWNLKCDILKSQIKNLIGISERRIFARNCKVKEVSNVGEIINFLNENHIQGGVNSSLKIGLYFQNELVSVMTFDHFEGRKKLPDYEWNLNRFCNKLNTNVIGGASKLLSFFIKNYDVRRLISYADRDWSVGHLYYKLGFNLVSITDPDYKYVIGEKRVHKSRFRKSKLKTELTESQYMSSMNIKKIFDCGKLKFEMIIN